MRQDRPSGRFRPNGVPLGSTVVRGCLAAVLAAALAGSSPSLSAARTPVKEACRSAGLSRSYVAAVEAALRARRDVWGAQLLGSRSGPSYEGVQRYLQPLLLAGHLPRQPSRLLTASGVYYLPFTTPSGASGAGAVALHVA